MSGDFLGGGLVFAIAATLWIVYLIPTWLRRRTFDATERNAVRMQQTIRALAETSVLPAEMRVEASARGVAEQKRLLRDAENHARVQLRAATARAIGYDDTGIRAKARRRGQRLLVSTVLLASVIGIATGTSFMLTNQGWQLLALSCVAFAVAIIVQNELSATVAVNARRMNATGLTSQAFADHAPVSAEVDSRRWTPTALPRPMHLSQGSIAAAVIASQAAAERLRLSGAESALIERLRTAGGVSSTIRVSDSAARVGVSDIRPQVPVQVSAQVSAQVAPSGLQRGPQAAPESVRQAPTTSTLAGRFASMGIVNDTDAGHIDLDAALRRRRAAG